MSILFPKVLEVVLLLGLAAFAVLARPFAGVAVAATALAGIAAVLAIGI